MTSAQAAMVHDRKGKSWQSVSVSSASRTPCCKLGKGRGGEEELNRCPPAAPQERKAATVSPPRTQSTKEGVHPTRIQLRPRVASGGNCCSASAGVLYSSTSPGKSCSGGTIAKYCSGEAACITFVLLQEKHQANLRTHTRQRQRVTRKQACAAWSCFRLSL